MYAVIMAGGRGTRFWPLSREEKPKHLLNITGEKTIIQQTIDRIKPIIPENNIYIITNRGHYDEVVRQCPNVPEENIIAEPMGRNTAPCIGLAAIYIGRKNPHAVMAVLPADHIIADEEDLRDTLAIAGKMAEQGEYLVSIGIRPTHPDTGYGYIEEGKRIETIDGKDIFTVGSFREKPDLSRAEEFVADGTFFWNSGTFIWKVSTILAALQKFLPELHEGLMDIKKNIGTERESDIIYRVYETIEPISIDYGVMEKSDRTLLIKGDFGWNDIGSWDALGDVFKKDDSGNAVRGTVIAIDASNSVVYSPDKLVALVGVDDLIVVETDDSLLVCKRDCCQDVKKVVEKIEEYGLKEYL